MPIIGFGFDKMGAERKAQITKQDKIQNNIKVTSIKATKVRISNEEKEAITVLFEFIVDYSNAGKLELLGHIIYYETPDKLKTIRENWDKNEKMPPEFGALIYNFILGKANIKALQLEEETGLPLHVKLPRVKIKQN